MRGDDPDRRDGEGPGAVGHHIEDFESPAECHASLRELYRDTETSHQRRRQQAYLPAHSPVIAATRPVHQRRECQEAEHQPVDHLVGARKQMKRLLVGQRIRCQGQPQYQSHRYYGQKPRGQPA